MKKEQSGSNIVLMLIPLCYIGGITMLTKFVFSIFMLIKINIGTNIHFNQI